MIDLTEAREIAKLLLTRSSDQIDDDSPKYYYSSDREADRQAASLIERLTKERDEAKALLAEAARALEPFAEVMFDPDDDPEEDWMPKETYPTRGDLRTARAVHAKIKGGRDE